MTAGCIFCRIAAGEIPAEMVYQDEEMAAFRDINPQAPTHIILIPLRHIPTLNDLKAEDAEMAGKLILRASELAEKEGIARDGYRTVFNCNSGAGQTVWHIHLHLLGGRSMGWPPG